MKTDPYLIFAGMAILLLIVGGGYAFHDLRQHQLQQVTGGPGSATDPVSWGPETGDNSPVQSDETGDLPPPEPTPVDEQTLALPALPPLSEPPAPPVAPQPPEPPPPPPVPQVVEDLQESIVAAGFSSNLSLDSTLEWYVRFGCPEVRDQFQRGDQFDRIEMKEALMEHQRELAKKRFRLTGLSFVAHGQRTDIESKGLLGELTLPLRVRGRKPFYQDRLAFSNGLSVMHPTEVNYSAFAFLTKDKTLRPCSWDLVPKVQENNGVLYHPEVPQTTLIFVFRNDIDQLKQIARKTSEYSVELELTNLTWSRSWNWGWYKRNALFEADGDCEELQRRNQFGLDGPQLSYFPTEPIETLPEILRATLLSLRVVHRSGALVGQYEPINPSPR